MHSEITPIALSMPFGMGLVNCYLIRAEGGFILIDTGGANKRADLVRTLQDAGCVPGNLRLILLTHGDFDHTGNAAYLRQAYGAKIAMHRNDWGMAERGDMFSGRKSGNALIGVAFRTLSGFGKKQRFAPDLEIEDGTDLTTFGLDARVLHLPGHSQGSLGVLTAEGELFCGDMFTSIKGPERNALMDDVEAFDASLSRLEGLAVSTVYPGHGTPFAWSVFVS
jgi:hydroxyacylglutathione hydrolase